MNIIKKGKKIYKEIDLEGYTYIYKVPVPQLTMEEAQIDSPDGEYNVVSEDDKTIIADIGDKYGRQILIVKKGNTIQDIMSSGWVDYPGDFVSPKSK